LARIACFSVDDLGALADDVATGSIHILYRLPGVANMNSLPWLRRLVTATALMDLFLCIAPTVCLAEAPLLPKKITTVEGITDYRLDNGLRVLLFPDASTSNFTVNMTV
jgi:hypothetical protein